MFGATVTKLCEAVPIDTETTHGREGGELVNRGTQLEWLLEWKAEMNKGRLRVLNFT